MDILFTGNKPQKKTYSYSVKENNNSNIITFILNKEIEGVDLSTLSCFVKVQGSDIDKDVPSVEVEEDKIKVHWTLLRKHTISHVLKVQLQFEGVDDIVWQTEILTLVLSETIKADEYIENKYPAVLSNHEARIKTLEEGGQPTPTKSKEFYYLKKTFASSSLYFKSNCRIALTTTIRTHSKGQKANWWGTKLGNKFHNGTEIERGDYFIEDFLSRLLGCEVEKILSVESDLDPMILFPMAFGVKVNGKPQYYLYQTEIELNMEVEQPMAKAIATFLPFRSKVERKFVVDDLEEADDLIHQTKCMVKFVEDYELKSTEKAMYWKGNMARNWLELQFCFAYEKAIWGENIIKVYILPIARRFA